MIQKIGLIFFFLLLFPASSFAATLSLSSSQTTLSVNEEFNVNVGFNINTSDGNSYYLRGVFFKEGTSNYCGYTWSGNSWYNGPYSNNGWSMLFPVTVYQSSWSGQLKAKMDSGDSGCQNSGIYNFKIQRYTGSGSSSFDDQNILTISVVIPTLTPTPTVVATPTSTTTPTRTPTPTLKVSVQTPTPFITPINSSDKNDSQEIQIIKGDGKDVLGIKDEITPTLTPTQKQTLVKGNHSSFIFPSPATFIIGGFTVITVACGILLFREWKKQKSEEL